MMSQKKFYISIISVLVGLNMAVLAFFLLTKPHPQHHPFPKNSQSEVIKLLHLNRQQATTFSALADDHKLQMNTINERQKNLLLSYFGSLTNDSGSTDKENLLNQFEHLERKKVEVTYHHFEEIKKLLNKNQLPEFEEFIRNITDKLLSGGEKNTPPPKDFN